jgi:hypothetical protein
LTGGEEFEVGQLEADRTPLLLMMEAVVENVGRFPLAWEESRNLFQFGSVEFSAGNATVAEVEALKAEIGCQR